MKLTTKVIKQLIREELSKVMSEADDLTVTLDTKRQVHDKIINLLPPRFREGFDSGQLNYSAFEDVVGLLMKTRFGMMGNSAETAQRIEDGIGSNEKHNQDARQMYNILQKHPQAMKIIQDASSGFVDGDESDERGYFAFSDMNK